ncbi:DUF1643 domain-containing protein [Cupriavidus sp. CuC1]|uniref:DUF1643 domain-containing protein n=1 Tax=Cupriavidus sp. CuC1 TaxID=3373131 RepID=UPI0037D8F377
MKHLATQTIDGEAGAILSDCEQYRYRLWREWDRTQPALGFIMLNPSTADHQANDPTITRCLQRALAGTYGRLELVNLFPLRPTNPDGLLSHPAPLGCEDAANGSIMDVLDRCSLVICAWGAHKAAPARAAEVLRIIRMCGRGPLLYRLGLNQDGSPKHPLYIAAKVRPQRFGLAAIGRLHAQELRDSGTGLSALVAQNRVAARRQERRDGVACHGFFCEAFIAAKGALSVAQKDLSWWLLDYFPICRSLLAVTLLPALHKHVPVARVPQCNESRRTRGPAPWRYA